MAEVEVTASQIGAGTWYLTWSGDGPFYVYEDGLLVEISTRTWRQVEVEGGARVTVQVFDSADDAPEGVVPGRLCVSWPAVSGAAAYTVAEYVDDAWVTRGRVVSTGEPWFRWRSRYLEDGQTHQVRVTPEDENGVTGLSWEIAVVCARKPDPGGGAVVSYDAETGVDMVAAA